jgi:GNAT superfamily N-acetyltransferase
VQTADNGQDATSIFRDPRLPGHVYAAPYALFEPSLAFVAQDAGGVGGYIVAALDSQAFEQRLERDWWPALRARHPEPSQDLAKGLSPPEQFALHAIHHPWGTPGELARGFPSHLHINLVPRLQGQGIGRQLIATVISALRDQGSHGLHLHVRHGNQRGCRVLPARRLRRASGRGCACLHHEFRASGRIDGSGRRKPVPSRRRAGQR